MRETLKKAIATVKTHTIDGDASSDLERKRKIKELEEEEKSLLAEKAKIESEINFRQNKKENTDVFVGAKIKDIAKKMMAGQDLDDEEKEFYEKHYDLVDANITQIRENKILNQVTREGLGMTRGIEGEGIEWGQNLAKQIKNSIDAKIEKSGKFKDILKKSEEWWLDTNKNKVAKATINAMLTVGGTYLTGFASTDIAAKGFWKIVQAGVASGLITSESAQKLISETAQKFQNINTTINNSVEKIAGKDNKYLNLYKNITKGSLILGAGLVSGATIVSTGVVSASTLAIATGGATARLGLTKGIDYLIKKRENKTESSEEEKQKFVKRMKWVKSILGLGVSVTTADLLLLSHGNVESPIKTQIPKTGTSETINAGITNVNANNFEASETKATEIKTNEINGPEIPTQTPEITPQPNTPETHEIFRHVEKGDGLSDTLEKMKDDPNAPEWFKKILENDTQHIKIGDFVEKINAYNNTANEDSFVLHESDEVGWNKDGDLILKHEGEEFTLAKSNGVENFVKGDWQEKMTDEKFMDTDRYPNDIGKVYGGELSTDNIDTKTDIEKIDDLKNNIEQKFQEPQRVDNVEAKLTPPERVGDINEIDKTNINHTENFDVKNIHGVEYTEESWKNHPMNVYQISLEDFAKVDKLNQLNIENIVNEKHLGEIDLKNFNSILKNGHAETILSLNEDDIEDKFTPLWRYMHKLQDITGLKFIAETATNKAETNENYIYRALMRAVDLGKLDQVKL